MGIREPVSIIIACTLGWGCSSSYMPRPGPRVAMIQQNGNPAYVRDGRVYEGGVFGGDIVEAVRGNPEAEEHARAYKNGMIGGFVATLGGGVSLVSGTTLLAIGSASNSYGSDRDTYRTAGGLLLAGGIAAYITGLVLMLNAQPKMWDAINVYNDGIGAGPVPYGYPPPGYVYPPLPPSSTPPTPAPSAAPPPASR
jgi:hypothetical protein